MDTDSKARDLAALAQFKWRRQGAEKDTKTWFTLLMERRLPMMPLQQGQPDYPGLLAFVLTYCLDSGMGNQVAYRQRRDGPYDSHYMRIEGLVADGEGARYSYAPAINPLDNQEVPRNDVPFPPIPEPDYDGLDDDEVADRAKAFDAKDRSRQWKEARRIANNALHRLIDIYYFLKDSEVKLDDASLLRMLVELRPAEDDKTLERHTSIG